MDRDEIEHFVAAKCGGVDVIAGRAVREIADRLADKARLAGSSPPSAEDLARIEAFLAIECPASEAPARLAQISRGNKFAPATEALAARLSAIQTGLNAGDEIRFSAALGRAFLYYTDFVFEMRASAFPLPLAAGGRYDRLLSDLGAGQGAAAVGCAVWPERLLAAGAAP
jgi:ATP phosphoribosyltransferase regulatory subunit